MRKNILFAFILCFISFGPLHAKEEGNSFIVCDNGIEMLEWDLEFVSHAEESIEALVCFFGGSTAQTVLNAFKTRLAVAPQLKIHVLASPVFIRPDDMALINELENTYPDRFHIEYATQVMQLLPDLGTIDNHVKLFIVDGAYFSVGGTNFEEKHCSNGTYTPPKSTEIYSEIENYLPAGMRDQDVVGNGAIAASLRSLFFELYSIWAYFNETQQLCIDPSFFKDNPYFFDVSSSIQVEKFVHSPKKRTLAPGKVRCVLGGPHQKVEHNAITGEYVRLINSAQHEIIIEHLYCFPTQRIFEALLDAVNRGVKLTLITNGIRETSAEGASLFGWANRLTYVPLFYGRTFTFWDKCYIKDYPIKNTHIFEYSTPDIFLHKKVMLVDNRYFIVGSYNLGTKSANSDYELILVIDSEEVACDFLKVHALDLKHSTEVTPEEACSWYFDPVTSYYGEVQRKYGGFL